MILVQASICRTVHGWAYRWRMLRLWTEIEAGRVPWAHLKPRFRFEMRRIRRGIQGFYGIRPFEVHLTVRITRGDEQGYENPKLRRVA